MRRKRNVIYLKPWLNLPQEKVSEEVNSRQNGILFSDNFQVGVSQNKIVYFPSAITKSKEVLFRLVQLLQKFPLKIASFETFSRRKREPATIGRNGQTAVPSPWFIQFVLCRHCCWACRNWTSTTVFFFSTACPGLWGLLILSVKCMCGSVHSLVNPHEANPQEKEDGHVNSVKCHVEQVHVWWWGRYLSNEINLGQQGKPYQSAKTPLDLILVWLVATCDNPEVVPWLYWRQDDVWFEK